MINPTLVNFAIFLADQLRAQCIKGQQLYVSGNMQKSIVALSINEEDIDVVIATDYASYTNTRGRMAGWVQRTIQNAARCFAENNNVSDDFINGINIRYE